MTFENNGPYRTKIVDGIAEWLVVRRLPTPSGQLGNAQEEVVSRCSSMVFANKIAKLLNNDWEACNDSAL